VPRLLASSCAPRWAEAGPSPPSPSACTRATPRAPPAGHRATRRCSPTWPSSTSRAIVHLEAAPPAELATARIYPGDLGGRLLELVSHGGSTSLQRSGENRIERLFANAQGQPASYLFVVENAATAPPRSREAGLAAGDSGSAAFVRSADGGWQLAGINTYRLQVRTPAATLDAGGGVVLAPHARWIEEVVKAGPPPPPAATPTPPPGQR